MVAIKSLQVTLGAKTRGIASFSEWVNGRSIKYLKRKCTFGGVKSKEGRQQATPFARLGYARLLRTMNVAIMEAVC